MYDYLHTEPTNQSRSNRSNAFCRRRRSGSCISYVYYVYTVTVSYQPYLLTFHSPVSTYHTLKSAVEYMCLLFLPVLVPALVSVSLTAGI